jgi:hypothetical protein
VKWHRKAEEEPADGPLFDLDAELEQTVERPAEPVSSMGAFAGGAVDSGGASFVGIPRARGNWDLVVTGEAPGLTGADELGFVAVDGGDIFMDAQLPEGDVTPLAETIEQQIQPPYRAYGARQVGDLWAVAARGVDVGRFSAVGDEIELTLRSDERQLVVDGRKSFGSVPELERLGAKEGTDFFARAVRIDDDLWELTISPL